jgi:putative peptidoglycan lipid II flippase
MHFLLQVPQLRIAGPEYRSSTYERKPVRDIIVQRLKEIFTIDLKHEGVKEIFLLMFPILLSLGAIQLNISVDNFFALSLGAGNTTALNLSWRVTNLPFGVFTVAIITVLYPLMSRQAASDDVKGIKESFSLGVREIGYMMMPATMGLVILSYPIIKVLFEHGSSGSDDTLKISSILIFHSLGLVFFGLLMILNRVFYAFKNVKIPLIVASISIIINLVLDWILMRYMDVNGLALSTSLVALFNVVVLLIILRKKVGNLGAKRIISSYSKILVSTAIAGTAVYFIWKYLSVYAYRSLYWLILGLLIVIVLGAGIYVACTIIFKMDEIRFVINMVKGKKNRNNISDGENGSEKVNESEDRNDSDKENG